MNERLEKLVKKVLREYNNVCVGRAVSPGISSIDGRIFSFLCTSKAESATAEKNKYNLVLMSTMTAVRTTVAWCVR